MILNKKQLKNFWKKVDKSGNCWEWIAGFGHCGYGQFRVGDKPQLSHRVSWKLENGPIPEGLFVLHKCDNPPCVNPKHLFLGTQKDNLADMTSKGRRGSSPGEKSWNSKLTADQVYQILKLHKTNHTSYKITADIYGVAYTTITNIVHRRAWKHLS